jgi:hypothetical protein
VLNFTKKITFGRALRSVGLTFAAALFVALSLVSADAWPLVSENYTLTVNFQNTSGQAVGNTLPPGQVTVVCGISPSSSAPASQTASQIQGYQTQQQSGQPTVGFGYGGAGVNYPNNGNPMTFTFPFGASGGAAGPNSASHSFTWAYTLLVPQYGTVFCAPVSASLTSPPTGTASNLVGATTGCIISSPGAKSPITPASGKSGGLNWPAGISPANAGGYNGAINDSTSGSLNIQFSSACPFLGTLAVVGSAVPGAVSGNKQAFTVTAKLTNASGPVAGAKVGWGLLLGQIINGGLLSGGSAWPAPLGWGYTGDSCTLPNGGNGGGATYGSTTGSDGTTSIQVTCTQGSQMKAGQYEQTNLALCATGVATNCVTWHWTWNFAAAAPPPPATLTMNVTVAGLSKAPASGQMVMGCALQSGNGPTLNSSTWSVNVGPGVQDTNTTAVTVPNVNFSAFYYASCQPTAFSGTGASTLKSALNMSTSNFAVQEVPSTPGPMTFTLTSAWGGPIVTPPPAAAYCCGPAGITLFSTGGVTNATSESAALTGASSTGTFAAGIGGTATFGDVIFIVDDAKGNRVPAGTVVTFKATGTGTNSGPITCNVPASATTVGTDVNGGQVTLHGATAKGWPGTCTVTASSSATSGSPSVTMTATYSGTLPAQGTLQSGVQPLSQADLAWFQQAGHLSLFADVNTTQDPNSADIDKDTPFYHDVCPMKGGGPEGPVPDTNFNAFGIRLNIGATWPSDWKSTQLLQVTYVWNTSGGRASNPTQTFLLSPQANGTPTGFTGFISGLSLYPRNSISSQWFQASITGLNGTSVTIKQNDLSGKVGVAITAGCYHGGPPSSTTGSGAATE